MTLPKAIDRLSSEVGGLSSLQREILSIIASPSISSDVRHRAAQLLRNLKSAYTKDKSTKRAAGAGAAAGAAGAALASSNTGGARIEVLDPADEGRLEDELEKGEFDDRVESVPVRTGEVLRVHGVYMDRKREFEIRVAADGKLGLWDKDKGRMLT